MSIILDRISIAPMMEYTDRHYRFLMRLFTEQTTLYTEMVTTKALLHGSKERCLQHSPKEAPLILQLGGSDPNELAYCAQLAAQSGFNGINLNVGCPSSRVKSGGFGACLMLQPELVGACIKAMRDSCELPVSVKTRIGVDDHDDYAFLSEFISQVHAQGCNTFIVHARKAWLAGLSPKENRSTPPLDYNRVYQLKKDFPELTIVLNGGVQSLAEVQTHLKFVDGVMIGRMAYQQPLLFTEVDQLFFNQPASEKKQVVDVLQEYFNYMQREYLSGTRILPMAKPLAHLWRARPGAKQCRQRLTHLMHCSIPDWNQWQGLFECF